MPKITVSLSPDGVDEAIARLKEYERGMAVKLDRLRDMVAQRLMEMAELGFNGAGYDDVIHEGMKVPNVSVHIEPKGELTLVIADGKEAVFAEFGAGVYYNPSGSPHPMTPPGVVPIGTYGKGYGARKIWGFYEDGELKLTHGTPASMPMYRALQALLPLIPQMAREVFAHD